jgi:glycopeptide antibiotics resistance protein
MDFQGVLFMIMINGNLFVLLGILIYLVGRSIFIGYTYRKQKKIMWLKEIVGFLFVIYLSMVIAVTLFPIVIGAYSNANITYSINLIPLKAIINNVSNIGVAYGGDAAFMIGLILKNVGGNILLFMPLGFLAPILWRKLKRFKHIIILGLIVSISIELLQLLQTLAGGWGRATDIDDVICNVLGAIIGYFIYILFFKVVDKYKIKTLQQLNNNIGSVN